MITKDLLKKMYIYIGPYYYKNKLVRIFRARNKDYSYVFYYDQQGELSLMNAKDSAILKNQIHRKEEIIQLNSEFETSGINSEPQENKATVKPDKVYFLKPNSIEARIVDWNFDNMVVEFVDKRAKEPYVSRVTLNSVTEDDIEKNDVYTLLECFEEYNKLEIAPDSNEILKRVDGLNIILTTRAREYIKSDTTNGNYSARENKIRIFESRNSGFESTIKHEFFHAMSAFIAPIFKGERLFAGFANKSHAFNEMMTVYLSEQGPEYNGYSNLMDKVFKPLFNNNVPDEVKGAYFNNDINDLYNALATEFKVPVDDVVKFTSCLEIYYNYEYKNQKFIYTGTNVNERNEAMLNKYVNDINFFILKCRFNKIYNNEDVISNEEFGQFASLVKNGIKPEYKEIFTKNEAFLLNYDESLGYDAFKSRVDILYKFFKASYPEENNDKTDNYDLITDIAMAYLPKGTSVPNGANLSDIVFGCEGKTDEDLAHYYALMSDANTLIEHIDQVVEKFNERGIIDVYKAIINQINEKKLLELKETNKELFNELMKTAMTYETKGYYNCCNAFSVLPKQEQEKFLFELYNNASEKQVNISFLNDIASFYNFNKTKNDEDYINLFPNNEVLEKMFKTLVINQSDEYVMQNENKIYHIFQDFYDKEELLESLGKKILGEAEYNKHIEEFNQVTDIHNGLDSDGDEDIIPREETLMDLFVEYHQQLQRENNINRDSGRQ